MQDQPDVETTGVPSDPDELLALSRNLRSLAEKLAGDPAAADDLVQDAWLAALEDGAPRARDLSAWLRGVVRRLARHKRARASRQRELERLNAARDAVVDETRLLEELSTYRMLRATVEGLREPYRELLIARYFDDSDVEELARARRQSSSTIRSQLSRGMQELREALDRKHQGDRAAWTLLLFPKITDEFPTTTDVSSTTREADRVPLRAVWGTPVVVGLALLVATSIAIGVWRPWEADHEGEPGLGERAEIAKRASADLPRVESASGARESLENESPSQSLVAIEEGVQVSEAGPTRRLQLHVTDAGGAPLREVSVRRFGKGVEGPFEGPIVVLDLLESELEHHEGSEIPGVRLCVRGPREAWSATTFVPLPPEGRTLELATRGSAQTIHGVVVDAHGEVASEASLVCSTGIRQGTLRLADGVSSIVRPEVTSADASGEFRFEGLARGEAYQIHVKTRTSPIGTQMVQSDEERVEVRLELPLGGSVTGVVHLPDGTPAAGAVVWYPGARFARYGMDADPVIADEAGRYEFGGLAAGVHHLFARAAEVDTWFASGLPLVEEGHVTNWDPQLEPHPGFSVRVLDEAGEPIVGELGFVYREVGKPNWGERFYTDEKGAAYVKHVPDVPLAVLVKIGAREAVKVLGNAHFGENEYVVQMSTAEVLKGGLRGVVLDSEGKAFERAEIGGVSNWELFFVDVDSVSGVFMVEAIEALPWSLQVFVPGYGAFELGEYEVGGEQVLDIGEHQVPKPRRLEIEWADEVPTEEEPWTLNVVRPNRDMSTRAVVTLVAPDQEVELFPGSYTLGPLADLRTWPVVVALEGENRVRVAD